MRIVRPARTAIAILITAVFLAACGTSVEPSAGETTDDQIASPSSSPSTRPTPTSTPTPMVTAKSYSRSPAQDRAFEEDLADGLEIVSAYDGQELSLDREFDAIADSIVEACSDLERHGYNGAWMRLEEHASSEPAVLAVIGHSGVRAYCPEHLHKFVDAAVGRWEGTTAAGTKIVIGHAEIAEFYPPWPAAPAGQEWLPAGWEEVGLIEWDESVAYVLRPDEYECGRGASACSGVTVLVRDHCPRGVYVELAFLTDGTVTDRGNEITASLYPWDQAFVGIDAYGFGGDAVRVSDINCMG